MHWSRTLPLIVLIGALVGWGPRSAEAEEPDTRVESGKAPPKESAWAIEVGGYLRAEAQTIADDPNVPFVGRNDGFRLRHARIALDATYADRVRLRLSADGAGDQRALNSTDGILRFDVRDAFGDIYVFPQVTIRVARFKPIFDLEENTSNTERPFIDRSLESRGVVAIAGFETAGLGVRRGLGFAVRSEAVARLGRFSFGYELAAQNGNEENATNNDNDALAYSGALLVHYGEKAYLFGAFRVNDRTEGDLPLRQDENDLGTAIGGWLRLDMLHVAGQFLVRQTSFPTTDAPDSTSFGGHLQALVRIPVLSGLEAGYRFAYYEPNDLFDADKVQEHTLGANLFVPRYRLRLMLNYTLALEQSGRELENNRLQALVEVRL